jgi:hypothetical protein
MFISFRGAVMAGLIWGIIALVLGLLERLVPQLGSLIPTFAGLSLGLYAVMFASVHYTARTRGGLFEHLVGGIIASIIAGLFLMVVSMLIPAAGASKDVGGGLVQVLLTGVLAGLFGALGMEVVNRFKL